MFDFGAGDADTGLAMGEPWRAFGWTDIDDDDPPVNLSQQITIPQGPAKLWVQAVASEDDRDDMDRRYRSRPTAKLLRNLGTPTRRSPPWSRLRRPRCLISGTRPGSARPASALRTGDYPVDFVMSCRLAVDVRLGADIRNVQVADAVCRNGDRSVGAWFDFGTRCARRERANEIVALGPTARCITAA